MTRYLHFRAPDLPQWTPETTIHVGDRYNTFFAKFYTTSKMIEVSSPVKIDGGKVVERHVSPHDMAQAVVRHRKGGEVASPGFSDYVNDIESALSKTGDALREALMLSRELVFERVRVVQFSDLPSRQKCIWLMPDRPDSISYWHFLNDRKSKIYLVEVDGEVHRGAEKWLHLQADSLSDLEERALRYWNGDGTGGVDDEIIAVGNIGVVEVIQLVNSDEA